MKSSIFRHRNLTYSKSAQQIKLNLVSFNRENLDFPHWSAFPFEIERNERTFSSEQCIQVPPDKKG